MEFEILTAFIGNFGFPIAITTYLLLRFEKKLGENTTVIRELIITIKTNGRGK